MTSSRIHGLDMSRATLLLMGVVVHSAFFSRWSGPVENPGFDWFITLSHSFRMEGFFAVAGYLMAITLPKRDRYLSNRMRQLLTPLVFTWLFVLPIGWFASGGESLRSPFDLGTLWFLITLSIASFMVWSLQRTGAVRILIRCIDGIPTYITLTLFFMSAYVLTSIGNKLIFDYDYGYGIYFPLASVLIYTPYLLLGFISYYSEKLSSILKSRIVIYIGLTSLTIYSIFILLYDNAQFGDVSFFHRFIHRGAVTFVSVSATFAILSLSLKIKAESAIASRISAAAFTIYLFHWTVLEVLHAFSRGWNPWVQFFLFIPIATATCYAAHQLISRSPLLLFMFNGRPFPTRARKVQPAE